MSVVPDSEVPTCEICRPARERRHAAKALAAQLRDPRLMLERRMEEFMEAAVDLSKTAKAVRQACDLVVSARRNVALAEGRMR